MKQKRSTRDYTLRVRLNAGDRKILAVLVRHHGVTSSEVVRMLLVQEASAIRETKTAMKTAKGSPRKQRSP